MAMTEQQARHAIAIAEKIERVANALASNMESLASTPIRDLLQFYVNPVGDGKHISGLKARFNHDSGYGVQDYLEQIQTILRDMLPTLDELEKERLDNEGTGRSLPDKQ